MFLLCVVLSAVDVRGSDMNVTFLNVSLDGGQITIPRDLLTQKQATGTAILYYSHRCKNEFSFLGGGGGGART